MRPANSLRAVLRVISWPLILTYFIWMWHGCRVEGRGELYALAYSYGTSLLLTVALEKVLPFRAQWNAVRMDRRVDAWPMAQDLAHTLITAASVEGTKAACEYLFVRVLRVMPWMPWVRRLPLWCEVCAAMVVFEFGAYWQHRLSHTCAYLWPFHAVHHCVPRMHAINTGRFHWFNQLRATIFGFPFLFLAGFSDDAIYELTGLLSVIGMLSHCNVDMRCGALNFIFNTPEQHRWHHSTRVNESNSNFGENLMIFDHIFGTFFNGNVRNGASQKQNAPDEVGRVRYCDGHPQAGLVRLPKSFIGQLCAPFTHNPLVSAWAGGSSMSTATTNKAAAAQPTLRSRLRAVWYVLAYQRPGPPNPYDRSYFTVGKK